MKIDPTLKLSLAIHENAGVYALLLGSGVSRAAGIPTGWDIVLDLIRSIAAMEGENNLSEPDIWYRDRFGTEPDYSKVLDQLTTTAAERKALLRSYFEPSEVEREQGIKTPTSAHRAIAKLAKSGYLRLILTTNFDRLIEEALQAEGVSHDLISTVDQMKGATPYVHGGCMVVKLHGDYRDTRIKNTTKELAKYPAVINALLDRILDEFGLVVCGWSAAYDAALGDAISRCPTRRYTTFWVTRGQLTEEAAILIQSRRAQQIQIENADQFFPHLQETVVSLEEGARPHPASTPVAVATAKRYLSDPRHRIPLHDLVHRETEGVYLDVASATAVPGSVLTQEGFVQRMRRYDALTEPLASIMAVIAYHDSGENSHLLARTITRLANFPIAQGVAEVLQHYPALIVTYAAGIAALSKKKYRNLFAVLCEPRYRNPYDREPKPALYKTNVWGVFDSTTYKWVPRPQKNEHTPASNHLVELLLPILSEYIPDEEEYVQTFDLFEYLLALVYADTVSENSFPVGRYWWRWGSMDKPPSAHFLEDGLHQGDKWPLLRAGFFKGSPQRVREVVQRHDEYLKQYNRMGW